MSRRIDLLAVAVILAGAGIVGRPAAASATYLNLWDRAVEGGIVYCCSTPATAKCCSNSGCMTRDGLCLVLR